ncbi:MAG: flagellar basal body P-ring protein FlgI [Acidobacteriota bacterium]|nr:flagellar basal body P-ring protein FlgI [Acidobacteriota bacterium]
MGAVAMLGSAARATDLPAGNSGAPVTHVPIKDISTVEGIRDNQLVGYGIVVGLAGTGDSQQTTFPMQTLAATLLRMGVSVPAASIRVQNLAAVFVEASLPAFSKPGSKVDVTVSSAGDARSLEGGLLLMTPLYGADGRVYVQAQGPLVVGGYSVASGGSSKQVNHPNTARIPLGGIVERGVTVDLTALDQMTVVLNDADFRTAESVATAINTAMERSLAHVVDSRNVRITVAHGEDVPALMARIESIDVPVYPRAKVVINERTGTVVIGGTVGLQPVSILHGGLTVDVVTTAQFETDRMGMQSHTEGQQVTQINSQEKPVDRIELKAGATVDDLVRNLQLIGATARDVISILQAMKAAGALEAEIEVL